MFLKRLPNPFPFHLALVSILALWVYMVAGHDIGDPDIWWHLRNAEYILEHNGPYHADPYSYTAFGDPVVDHTWLAELVYYAAWRMGGLLGIYVFMISLLELIMLGTFYWATKYSGNVKAAFLVTCFSVLLAAVSFGPRTLLFGYVFILILLLILWRYRTTGQAPLWCVPLLFCLWINTHGSWMSGMIIFGLFIASGFWQGSWGLVDAVKWKPEQLKKLLVTAGASVAALFVNPYHYKLVIYPFDLMFHQKLNVGHVEEWASVNFHDGRGKVVLITLFILLLGAMLGRRRWKLEEVGMAVLALYLGLTHVRFLFLAAILLAPLIAKLLDFVPPYQPEIDKPGLNAVIFAGILVIMASRFPSRPVLENFVAKRFPTDALMYAKAHGLPGRVFNLYMWGGYITWHHPEIKTFVDSRADIFEYRGVLKDYLDTTSLKDSFKVLDKYQIRYVLMPTSDPLSYVLSHHPDWKVNFKDNVAMLIERVRPPPAGAATGAPAGKP